jgi:hypothetical protein
MAQTDSRSGFRLPWTAERSETGSSSDGASVTADAGDGTGAVIETATDGQVDPGHGPGEPTETTLATDATSPLQLVGEAQVADAAAVTSHDPAALGGTSAPDAVTPDRDTHEGVTHDGVAQDAAAEPQRRHTKLMADLSRAMQVAAETTRNETMTRFETEAKTVADDIRAAAATEVADLRRRADDDVTAVREWSKAEIARIRDLTEGRIAERRASLDGELADHAEVVEARIERVATTVTAFREEMDGFFTRLMAEEDPTRIATMAEVMPEPPSLAEIAASIRAPEPAPFAPVPLGAHGDLETPIDASGPAPLSVDFAAAEAEALDFGGDLDLELPPAPLTGDVVDQPAVTADSSSATAGEASPVTATGTPAVVDPPLVADTDAQGRVTTRVVVLGLVSVASIARFKRELGHTPGIATIGVASGPDGEFVFTVTHDPSLDLAGAVLALEGFEARIDRRTADTLEIAAHDPDIVD